jgi:hypothetical protein
MRSWLASGQARQCQDMAHLLGVHRYPMGRWLEEQVCRLNGYLGEAHHTGWWE